MDYWVAMREHAQRYKAYEAALKRQQQETKSAAAPSQAQLQQQQAALLELERFSNRYAWNLSGDEATAIASSEARTRAVVFPRPWHAAVFPETADDARVAKAHRKESQKEQHNDGRMKKDNNKDERTRAIDEAFPITEQWEYSIEHDVFHFIATTSALATEHQRGEQEEEQEGDATQEALFTPLEVKEEEEGESWNCAVPSQGATASSAAHGLLSSFPRSEWRGEQMHTLRNSGLFRGVATALRGRVAQSFGRATQRIGVAECLVSLSTEHQQQDQQQQQQQQEDKRLAEASTSNSAKGTNKKLTFSFAAKRQRIAAQQHQGQQQGQHQGQQQGQHQGQQQEQHQGRQQEQHQGQQQGQHQGQQQEQHQGRQQQSSASRGATPQQQQGAEQNKNGLTSLLLLSMFQRRFLGRHGVQSKHFTLPTHSSSSQRRRTKREAERRAEFKAPTHQDKGATKTRANRKNVDDKDDEDDENESESESDEQDEEERRHVAPATPLPQPAATAAFAAAASSGAAAHFASPSATSRLLQLRQQKQQQNTQVLSGLGITKLSQLGQPPPNDSEDGKVPSATAGNSRSPTTATENEGVVEEEEKKKQPAQKRRATPPPPRKMATRRKATKVPQPKKKSEVQREVQRDTPLLLQANGSEQPGGRRRRNVGFAVFLHDRRREGATALPAAVASPCRQRRPSPLSPTTLLHRISDVSWNKQQEEDATQNPMIGSDAALHSRLRQWQRAQETAAASGERAMTVDHRGAVAVTSLDTRR